jgi:hypothetical protein
MLSRMTDISPAVITRYKQIADKTKPAESSAVAE